MFGLRDQAGAPDCMALDCGCVVESHATTATRFWDRKEKVIRCVRHTQGWTAVDVGCGLFALPKTLRSSILSELNTYLEVRYLNLDYKRNTSIL